MQVPQWRRTIRCSVVRTRIRCGRIEGRPSRGGDGRGEGGGGGEGRGGRMSNALASATTSTSAITKSLCERY